MPIEEQQRQQLTQREDETQIDEQQRQHHTQREERQQQL